MDRVLIVGAGMSMAPIVLHYGTGEILTTDQALLDSSLRRFSSEYVPQNPRIAAELPSNSVLV